MFPVKVHDSTIFTKTRYLFQKESKATVKQKMLNHFFFRGENIDGKGKYRFSFSSLGEH